MQSAVVLPGQVAVLALEADDGQLIGDVLHNLRPLRVRVLQTRHRDSVVVVDVGEVVLRVPPSLSVGQECASDRLRHLAASSRRRIVLAHAGGFIQRNETLRNAVMVSRVDEVDDEGNEGSLVHKESEHSPAKVNMRLSPEFTVRREQSQLLTNFQTLTTQRG